MHEEPCTQNNNNVPILNFLYLYKAVFLKPLYYFLSVFLYFYISIFLYFYISIMLCLDTSMFLCPCHDFLA